MASPRFMNISFFKYILFLAALCMTCSPPLASAAETFALDCPGQVGLGETFLVRARSPEVIQRISLNWGGRDIPMAVTGTAGSYEAQALLGVGLDMEEKTHQLSVAVEEADGVRRFHVGVDVVHRKYPEQHLKVARKYTALSQKSLDRHYAEKALVTEALSTVTPRSFLKLPLVRPVKGGVSSDFGMRRFFNGEPRKPHSGVDLRGAEGTPVLAACDGVVLLTGNHYFAGNSVYIDHGQGVVSMYFHLSKIDVKKGQKVSGGDVIGKVGKTGRVTGPHLHFGLRVPGGNVDPMLLFPGGGGPRK